jgi:hypothetical protein
MSENVLRKASLEKEVFDLHPGHEPVLVVVRLPEQRLVSTNRKNESLERKYGMFIFSTQHIHNFIYCNCKFGYTVDNW